MESREGSDIDDDFSEIYKAYTGPQGSKAATYAQDNTAANKRSRAGSHEEEEGDDPNAVPTDFTSREAKVWEAKSKAIERNWKKRKEEEMICKICGESGHFTQGCPSTLGANRKSQDFFERVAAREPHVKALFTEKVVNKIENDIGCKIKIEEKFIIVSGKDRLILKKGVDAVHKIKENGELRGSVSSPVSRSKSPERRSPVTSRLGRPDIQRSYASPHSALQTTDRYGRPDKTVEDHVREDLQKMSRGSPQAHGNDGIRGRSSNSKSPARPSYVSNSYNTYDGRSQNRGAYMPDGWNADRYSYNMQSARNFENPAFPQMLEELELEYKKEAMDLGRIRDKEEDEENYKHREAIREIREGYTRRLSLLRANHAKQWEEYLQLDAGRRRQQLQQHISPSGYGYKQPGYPEYDNSEGNPYYSGATMAMDSRGRHPNAMENYSSRQHDTYEEFQHQRRDEFARAHNRF